MGHIHMLGIGFGIVWGFIWALLSYVGLNNQTLRERLKSLSNNWQVGLSAVIGLQIGILTCTLILGMPASALVFMAITFLLCWLVGVLAMTSLFPPWR